MSEKKRKRSSLWLPWQWWTLSFSWLFWPQKKEGLSFSALRGNSVLSAVFALSLGVGALSFTLSLVSGFERVLSQKVEEHMGSFLLNTRSVNEATYRAFISDLDSEDFQQIEALWQGQALLVGPKGGRGVYLEVRKSLRGKELFDSQEFSNSSEIPVRIGRALADYLGVTKGTRFRMLLPGVLEQPLTVQVQEIKSFGVHDFDARTLVLPAFALNRQVEEILSEEQKLKFLEVKDQFKALRIFSGNPSKRILKGKRLEDLRSLLDQKSEALFSKKAYLLRSWREQKKNLMGSIGLDKKILSVVLSLLVLVAALNVAAALMVLYFERDREIILIRSLGMTPRQLRVWIQVKALILGFLSSALGLLGAWFLSLLLSRWDFLNLPAEIYNVNQIPFYFRFSEQLGTYFFGVFAAWLVAYLLSMRLSKMSLVEVLGHRR